LTAQPERGDFQLSRNIGGRRNIPAIAARSDRNEDIPGSANRRQLASEYLFAPWSLPIALIAEFLVPSASDPSGARSIRNREVNSADKWCASAKLAPLPARMPLHPDFFQ
jgi:hypothetical protein